MKNSGKLSYSRYKREYIEERTQSLIESGMNPLEARDAVYKEVYRNTSKPLTNKVSDLTGTILDPVNNITTKINPQPAAPVLSNKLHNTSNPYGCGSGDMDMGGLDDPMVLYADTKE